MSSVVDGWHCGILCLGSQNLRKTMHSIPGTWDSPDYIALVRYPGSAGDTLDSLKPAEPDKDVIN